MLTGNLTWQTPYGTVAADYALVRSLTDGGITEDTQEVVVQDPAMAELMPFIRYYLPDVQVVPVLLSGYMHREAIQKLANQLSTYVTSDTVVVASVDFSHYLTSAEAKERDAKTLQFMNNFDYAQILSLNSEYTDSPPAIVALLMIMQNVDATSMEVLHHTNSGELLGDDTVETTSYFCVVYY